MTPESKVAKNTPDLQYRFTQPIEQLKVAVVTPTYNRAVFLAQCYRYFMAQQGFATTHLHWFVLDDSAEPSWQGVNDRVHYQYISEKMPIGHKRNVLNAMALAWGADVICSMDDDDWYSATYVQEMVALLHGSDACFAGSSESFIYHWRMGKMVKIDAVGRANHSCNGVLCYKAIVLQHSQYSDKTESGEEPGFLNYGRYTLLQHPDVRKLSFAVAHSHNTVSKRNYFIKPDSGLYSLDDFAISEEDRQFYHTLAGSQPL